MRRSLCLEQAQHPGFPKLQAGTAQHEESGSVFVFLFFLKSSVEEVPV